MKECLHDKLGTKEFSHPWHAIVLTAKWHAQDVTDPWSQDTPQHPYITMGMRRVRAGTCLSSLCLTQIVRKDF